MPFGKWADFNSCVLDIMKSQGKDEESAKRICGALQARTGKEGFSWVGEVQAHKKNLIRGKAIHPIKTYHPEDWETPERVYLEEELEKAAHSLVGKPLLLDHVQPVDGKVLAAQYEEGAIEYVAELNDEQVLNWIRDGAVKHCSIDYYANMEQVNGFAPRGIQFNHLALLKDFAPGDPASSVEVWEGILKRLKEAKEQAQPEEFIYYPVRDPAAFLEDRFSTTWIDRVNGVQAIYGRLRENPEISQPMALLFMKANGWTLQGIQTWLHDHPQYAEPSAAGVQASPTPPTQGGLITEMKKFEEAVWGRAKINDLADSAFAIILPGGQKENGKTVPRSLRKFPHHNPDGSLDLAHLRNANARLPQSDLSAAQKARAAAHLDKHKKQAGIGAAGEEEMIKKWTEQGGDVPEEQIGEVPEVPEQLEIGAEPTLDEVIATVEDALGEINDAIDQVNANFQALQVQKAEAETYRNELTATMDQKKALEEALKSAEEKVRILEKEKADLARKLGEAVIEPGASIIPSDMLSKREIRRLLPERVPHSYGHHYFELWNNLRRLTQ